MNILLIRTLPILPKIISLVKMWKFSQNRHNFALYSGKMINVVFHVFRQQVVSMTTYMNEDHKNNPAMPQWYLSVI